MSEEHIIERRNKRANQLARNNRKMDLAVKYLVLEEQLDRINDQLTDERANHITTKQRSNIRRWLMLGCFIGWMITLSLFGLCV